MQQFKIPHKTLGTASPAFCGHYFVNDSRLDRWAEREGISSALCFLKRGRKKALLSKSIVTAFLLTWLLVTEKAFAFILHGWVS